MSKQIKNINSTKMPARHHSDAKMSSGDALLLTSGALFTLAVLLAVYFSK